MPTLSLALSLTLSPASTTSGNPIHRPFPYGLLSPEERARAERVTYTMKAVARKIAPPQLPGSRSRGARNSSRCRRTVAEIRQCSGRSKIALRSRLNSPAKTIDVQVKTIRPKKGYPRYPIIGISKIFQNPTYGTW
jgi:hypothetical protein